MIIDFRSDPAYAAGFDVVDVETGESLGGLAIWRADDEAGIIWRYVQLESGEFLVADNATGAIASIDERRAIRIVPKGSPPPAKAKTWRDDPPML